MLVPRIFIPKFKKGKFFVEVKMGTEKKAKVVGKFEGKEDNILREIITSLFFDKFPGKETFKYFQGQFAGSLIKGAKDIPSLIKDKENYAFDGIPEDLILKSIKRNESISNED